MATSPSLPSSSSATRRPSSGGTVPTRTGSNDIQTKRTPAEAFAALQKPRVSNIQAKRPDSRPAGSAPSSRNTIPKTNRLADFTRDQYADSQSADQSSGLSDDSVSPENSPSVLNQGGKSPFSNNQTNDSQEEMGNDSASAKNAAFAERERSGQQMRDSLIPPSANADVLEPSEAASVNQAKRAPDAVDKTKRLAAALGAQNALAKQEEGEAEEKQSALSGALNSPQAKKALKPLKRNIVAALADTIILAPLAFLLSLKMVQDNSKDPNATASDKLTDGSTAAILGGTMLVGIFVVFIVAVPFMLPFLANAMGRTWMTEQFGIATAAIFTPFY